MPMASFLYPQIPRNKRCRYPEAGHNDVFEGNFTHLDMACNYQRYYETLLRQGRLGSLALVEASLPEHSVSGPTSIIQVSGRATRSEVEGSFEGTIRSKQPYKRVSWCSYLNAL